MLEFALGLPAEQFRRGKYNRWLMRYALRSVLPPEICWNPRKDDPARLEPLLDAFAEALPVVRRMLDARAKPPSRARYVDLPRPARTVGHGSVPGESTIRTARQRLAVPGLLIKVQT